MSKVKSLLSFLSYIGFILLIPVLFYAFGISAPVNFLENNLGVFGNPAVLTLIGFILIAILTFFGGGDHIRSTILGFIIGLLFVSTAVEMGFMTWFKNLISQTGFFDNLPLNYLLGVAIVFIGIRMSYGSKPNFLKEISFMFFIPLVLIFGFYAIGVKSFNANFSLSLNKGISSLGEFIDESYRTRPEVADYVANVDNDKNLSEEEKLDKIKALQKKIEKLEKDQAILNKLKEENALYKENMGDMKDVAWCTDAKNDEEKTKTFAEAVTPNKPCVRDFAVNLAKKAPGPYGRPNAPGKEGIQQVCSIHLYLSSNWKYVSDPTMVRDDYYSPASRSLAIGMAGDCDDYSVVMASSVEAVGGISRIMGGFCSGGGHAWAEVLIGTKEDWKQAIAIIREFFKDSQKQIVASIDDEGNYWLPLDWRLGEYTCNDNKAKLMNLYTSLDEETILNR